MIIISYFTIGYRLLAKQLEESCKRFGLEYSIREMADTGSWNSNCGMKPTFIADMLAHFDEPVLWVDADAEIVAPLPRMRDCDMSYFRTRWNRNLSGCVYFQPTPMAFRFLKSWAGQIAADPTITDEDGLTRALADPGDMKIDQLPPGMLYVFDLWPKQYRKVRPIILHKQASRAGARPGGVPTKLHDDVKRSKRELRGR